MADLSDPAERDDDAHSRPPPRLALLSIGGFWLFYFVIVTLRGMLLGIGSLGGTLGPRTPVPPGGPALSYVIYRVLRACPSATLARSVVIAMLLAVPASILYSATNWYAFRSVNE